jgi:putative ABC transport system substrate-binding protein
MSDQLKRREFITLLDGAAAAWPLAARAQHALKTHTIGYLSPAMPVSSANFGPYFSNALQKLGWIEGQNIAIERRYAENQLERLPELAAELVRLNVEVIVAVGAGRPRSESGRNYRGDFAQCLLAALDIHKCACGCFREG